MSPLALLAPIVVLSITITTKPAATTATAAAPAAAAGTATAPAPEIASYRGHGADSVSPEVLARHAPRPIDPDLRRKIQSYLDLRSPSAGMLAPDGQRLYFNWNVTGVSQVWRLDGPERFPVQMTGGEDPTTVVDITPDGKWLVLSRDRKGEENPGLYLQPSEGGALITVYRKSGVQAYHQYLTADGKYLWYSANDVEPTSRALYRYELATRQSVRRWAEPGLWRIADFRPDGQMLLERARGSAVSEYWQWDPESGSRTPLVGTDESEEYSAAFGAGDGELLVLTPRLGEFRRLYRRRGGELTPITRERSVDVKSFSIDRARTRILVTWNDGGFYRVEALDARSFTPIAMPELPRADHVYASNTSRDGRWSTFSLETARAPRQSFVHDWQSGQTRVWLRASTPEVETERFAEATLESYPARDGTSIPMLVRRPARCAAEPCPVVVQFHGGPEGQTVSGFSPRAQLFVDEGFVFAEPNVRGSDGYGKAWFHADDGPRRLDVITDIEDAARHIRSAWAKDGRAPRIGIMGGSYGGYATLMGMTRFGGSYDAGVSVVGISNLLTFLENTAPYRRVLRVNEYGDPVRDRKALIELSPTTWLDRLSTPLLLIQGVSDPRVPVGEALQMHDALAKRGVPTELVIFPDEGHGAQKRDNQVLQTGYALEFFKRHLLAAAPAPASAKGSPTR